MPWLGLPESKWLNPFKLRRNANRESRAKVIVRYERHLYDSGLIVQTMSAAALDVRRRAKSRSIAIHGVAIGAVARAS